MNQSTSLDNFSHEMFTELLLIAITFNYLDKSLFDTSSNVSLNVDILYDNCVLSLICDGLNLRVTIFLVLVYHYS